MPHALFLGTSLATVDRLGLCPEAPVRNARRSYKLPSLFKRRSGPVTTVTEDQPMDDLAEGSSVRRRHVASARETEEAKDADYDVRMKQYEKDLRKFDKINWTDLHLLHYQVSRSRLPRS